MPAVSYTIIGASIILGIRRLVVYVVLGIRQMLRLPNALAYHVVPLFPDALP